MWVNSHLKCKLPRDFRFYGFKEALSHLAQCGICQNTDFLWSVYFLWYGYDSVPTRENTAHRKSVFAHISCSIDLVFLLLILNRWNMPKYRLSLIRILSLIRRQFCPNTGKYCSEEVGIWAYFTQYWSGVSIADFEQWLLVAAG